jgi:hypothetical protein
MTEIGDLYDATVWTPPPPMSFTQRVKALVATGKFTRKQAEVFLRRNEMPS